MRLLPVLLACAAAALSVPAAAAPNAIERAVRAPTRDPALVARDTARHPAQELAFFGVTPRSTVVEIWPGGGYWTQILGPLLHDHGTFYLAMGDGAGDRIAGEFALDAKFKAMLDADPAVYGHVKLTAFGAHDPNLAPPGSADVVLTFRNLHNWLEENDAPAMLAAIRRALKPGGTLGIEDHRGNTTAPQDPKSGDGYVRQPYAIALIEKAGFAFVASSQMNANPRDTANWPGGVWTLPPTLALKGVDRAKYQAIGEADNFVLRFRKTAS